jgi:heme exporter protein D
MNEFLSMGGYAAFIWPTYAVAAMVLGGLLGVTWSGMRRREAELEALRAANRGKPGDN